MTSFRVDLAALDSLVEQMSAVEARLRDVHDDVASRMRRLQVVWTGRAATEHDRAYQQWSSGSLEVHESLTRLREIARMAHGNYSAAVTANRTMWSL